MNGSDDEQHDSHVKCYRISVAVYWDTALAWSHQGNGKSPGRAGPAQMTQAQPEQFLPRKERIPKEAKVIDENGSQKVGGCTDSIANMLDWQDWRCTGINALRRAEIQGSKAHKPASGGVAEQRCEVAQPGVFFAFGI
jgi:hypothetical protein